MRHPALLFLLSSTLTVANFHSHAQAPARPRPRTPAPACRPLTTDMLSQPLSLPEGCYTVNQFANVAQPLTLAPGSTLVFGNGSALSIESNGSLEAIGTPAKPILLRGRDTAAGSWSGLTISSRSSHNHLSYVTVDGAGVKGSDNAAIVLAPGSQLSIDHSTVKRSLGTGLYVMDNALLEHFEANHFLNTDIPLRLKASDIPSIDAATTFADNTNNVVVIPFGSGNVDEDALWRKLAVPYRFEASVNVSAHLKLEPGTQLQFRENLPLNVTQNGSLTAIGTPTDPIVFTGTDDTKGYWSGIFFESASSSNILRHTEIRFSGSRAGAVQGGIGISHHASAIIETSTITSCPTGIYVFSEGTLNPDAASSNHFTNVDRNIFTEP